MPSHACVVFITVTHAVAPKRRGERQDRKHDFLLRPVLRRRVIPVDAGASSIGKIVNHATL